MSVMNKKLYNRNSMIILLFFPIAALLLYGKDLSKKEVHQFGLVSDLESKNSSFYASIMSIKRHGNIGFGLLKNNNGFLLGCDGDFFIYKDKGIEKISSMTQKVSFAYITQFKQTLLNQFKTEITEEDLNLYVLPYLEPTLVSIFQLSGSFSNLVLSDFDFNQQGKFTYDPLNLVNLNDISGTIVGFIFPAGFMLPLKSNFVWFFVSNDEQKMGRVIRFKGDNLRLFYDSKKKIVIHL